MALDAEAQAVATAVDEPHRPKWMEMLKDTISEAQKLDMNVDMVTGTGWCFGGPNVGDADANALALQLGHTNANLLFNTYRQAVRPAEAAKYWQIKPDAKQKRDESPGSAAPAPAAPAAPNGAPESKPMSLSTAKALLKAVNAVNLYGGFTGNPPRGSGPLPLAG